jgi:hypothetical protein
MKPDLTVDTTEVRATASELEAAGIRVSAGAAETPETVAVPRWKASDAAALAAEAIRRQVADAGAGIAAAAREIVAAVVDYEAADERSATRMRAAA